MKLINKKTGEVAIFGEGIVDLNQIGCKNVAEMMMAGWEDYEEPKGYWFIDCAAPYPVDFCEFNEDTEDDKLIGNYFETKEEAEKAVEKLKALKRLKDKGFRFRKWDWSPDQNIICGNIIFYIKDHSVDTDDLDLLFGGEE